MQQLMDWIGSNQALTAVIAVMAAQFKLPNSKSTILQMILGFLKIGPKPAPEPDPVVPPPAPVIPPPAPNPVVPDEGDKPFLDLIKKLIPVVTTLLLKGDQESVAAARAVNDAIHCGICDDDPNHSEE